MTSWIFCSTTCSVELWKCSRDRQTATATEVAFTDTDETEMGNSELEEENIIHDQKMEGGSSKNEQ